MSAVIHSPIASRSQNPAPPSIVADTADIEAVTNHKPQDASTNASLLSHATRVPAYRHFVEECAEIAKGVQH
jgi:transaldolase